MGNPKDVGDVEDGGSVVSAGAAGARFPFPGRRNRTSQEWILWLPPVSLAAFGFDLPKKK